MCRSRLHNCGMPFSHPIIVWSLTPLFFRGSIPSFRDGISASKLNTLYIFAEHGPIKKKNLHQTCIGNSCSRSGKEPSKKRPAAPPRIQFILRAYITLNIVDPIKSLLCRHSEKRAETRSLRKEHFHLPTAEHNKRSSNLLAKRTRSHKRLWAKTKIMKWSLFLFPASCTRISCVEQRMNNCYLRLIRSRNPVAPVCLLSAFQVRQPSFKKS